MTSLNVRVTFPALNESDDDAIEIMFIVPDWNLKDGLSFRPLFYRQHPILECELGLRYLLIPHVAKHFVQADEGCPSLLFRVHSSNSQEHEYNPLGVSDGGFRSRCLRV